MRQEYPEAEIIQDIGSGLNFKRKGGFSIKHGKVYLAKIGRIKVVWSRKLPSLPSSVTVIKDAADRYFVSFVVEVNPIALPDNGKSIGIDLGILDFATFSIGEKVKASKPLKKNLRKLHKLSRAISDLGWRSFRTMLEAKSQMYGRDFRVISRWEATSQRCSGCGQIGGKKELSVREWTCLFCCAVHDRDLNAALNIKVAGGLPETVNGRGGRIKTTSNAASSSEASTHQFPKQLSLFG